MRLPCPAGCSPLSGRRPSRGVLVNIVYLSRFLSRSPWQHLFTPSSILDRLLRYLLHLDDTHVVPVLHSCALRDVKPPRRAGAIAAPHLASPLPPSRPRDTSGLWEGKEAMAVADASSWWCVTASRAKR
ncbi:hypothetical protein U9M48_001275 [Paspalum notatum var. saurae]|uniref:Uncharacterized protein n=1 Tax=Paspalum notatum var. saurae TaxID=547442 RepID=A0AAQ3PFQ2_PASNO